MSQCVLVYQERDGEPLKFVMLLTEKQADKIIESKDEEFKWIKVLVDDRQPVTVVTLELP